MIEVSTKVDSRKKGVSQMATFNVKVVVSYEYEVEADSADEAEKMGWKYEDYYQFGEVDSIDVEEQESEDEDEDE
jgi:2-phospho-L-lactate guanylyltransferase (CobY/MobA/RfbA family)